MEAQDSEESTTTEKKKNHFSIAFGAAAGNFSNKAPISNDIYSNRSISRIYFAGIGSNTFYIIGKYREFTAFGESILENINVKGKADWKQKFYNIGLRIHSDEHPIYAEVLYVITHAEESITTVDPVVPELTNSGKTKNTGMGFSVGLALNIAGPIAIFAEGEYSVMMRKEKNEYGRENPELGGFCASAGLLFAL